MRLLIHDYLGHPFPLQLARELAHQGHEVLHACATHPCAPRADPSKLPGDAPTLILRRFPFLPPHSALPSSFLSRRRLEIAHGRRIAHLVGTWRPDGVLSVHTPTEPQGAILKATRALRAPFLFWLQDFASLAPPPANPAPSPLFAKLAADAYHWLLGRQLRASHRIVIPSNDLAPRLEPDFRVPENRLAIIPNWAPLAELPLPPKDNPWSRRHRLADRFVYLYAGSLALAQHPDLLLDLAEHTRRDPQVRVVVLSEGPGAAWLAAQQKTRQLPNLLLLPFQDSSHMPEVLATGDVLLALLPEAAPSAPCPTKVLSSLSAARPLLLAGPAHHRAAHLIRQENLGLAVPPNDSPAFLAAAQRLRGDAPLAARCAQRARDYAERHFPIEPIAAKFLQLFPPSF